MGHGFFCIGFALLVFLKISIRVRYLIEFIKPPPSEGKKEPVRLHIISSFIFSFFNPPADGGKKKYKA